MLDDIKLNGKRYQLVEVSEEGRDVVVNLPEDSILLDLYFHPAGQHNLVDHYHYKYLEPKI